MSDDGARTARQVWLVRHAKAAKDSPDGLDHGRPLTKRGRAQAEEASGFLKRALAERLVKPTLVLSSSAARALQTAEILMEGIGPPAQLEVEDELYEADADDVIRRLRRVDDAIRSVMVVGHNPTIAELAYVLVSDDSIETNARLRSIPTCTLVQIGMQANPWREIDEHSGMLGDYFVPDV